uniref:HORMA domain-containing protein n=1 Tax=Aureoumbra lagunensis TaxID=44058 RepID=A0A7S3NK88_9STRA|mmetsp:Transcript_17141/g.22252  ORF Transcript_17141/g.22252 Transcript_17141/m.22252 type:complete len:226 (+) Transcript_17141:66-743(+)|eukprot:CAMPEP_0197291142 /NCGR_PEP_ID=MMETSP0890-20130614/11699_1 /TAXON_ID=44058 ORGANISM="Aureoumbra lagunensis, Strain CCMP1510" /NCGR_SAMPLE_ID=MMETSP0890 /ASSEMBLY_ACC=CAM_ASM_000533 /LENGTH=225 /DNA_ID=CAMNT_0042763747 /DNA_START=50 /DNA_END=727 /DNA_ORIENTATION=+
MATTKTISLSGSVEIVREFFEFAINSILYQRGIYPPENFSRVAKYGLGMMVTTDEGLRSYMRDVLSQLNGWLETGDVQRLVVVVTGVDSEKTLERWVFAVETSRCDKENTITKAATKSSKDITNEIQAIIRQITASVTFLPLLDEPCAFDLLVYTRKSSSVPGTWEDTDPRYIPNANEVKLRSFTTKIHNIDTAVSYCLDEHDNEEPTISSNNVEPLTGSIASRR